MLKQKDGGKKYMKFNAFQLSFCDISWDYDLNSEIAIKFARYFIHDDPFIA